MSIYYPSFSYLGINSRKKNLIVAHLDGGDQGESDSFLGMDPIYTDSADGTQRFDYGAKFNSVATPRITVIKQDGSNMSVAEIRECLKWLTGSRKTSPLDITEHFEDEFVCAEGVNSFVLYNQADMIYSVYVNGSKMKDTEWSYDVNTNTVVLASTQSDGARIKVVYNKIKFSFIGRVTNVWHYKMDARTVGLVIEFTSISPWAISPVQRVSCEVNGTEDNPTSIPILNTSDDVDTPVYMKTTYKNTGGTALVLTNTNIGENTEINNLAINEVVTMDGNQIITSSNPSRIFGNDFNFIFPKLASDDNLFHAIGVGTVTFEYRTPIKIGDCAIDLDSKTDPICDPSGDNIVVDTLDWSRISNVPEMYTKSEVDSMLANFTQSDVYTKSEIDSMLENFVSDDVYTKSEIDEKFANIDVSGIDTYTKAEIDEKLSNITASGVDISEEQLNAMLTEVLGG